ncbi:MAG: SLC13 family permease [Planctomycetota bacterium]|nr:SLC13 family permease [Planctomycetota bacterium]
MSNDRNDSPQWVQTVGKRVGFAAFALILLWPWLTSQQIAAKKAEPPKAAGATDAAAPEKNATQPAPPRHPQPAGGLLDWCGPPAHRLAAVTLLMAIFWTTQAIPISVTALIPIVAFPLLGIQSANVVSQAYINANVFLFLGGFIIALGIEKWGLHRRMALHIVRVIGTSPKTVILGFMVATAFLSMWISNTASTLMMLPIGMALVASLRDLSDDATPVESTATLPAKQTEASPADSAMQTFSSVLMLSIAYAASIGGFTTLVGTPTNVQFQEVWRRQFPGQPELSAGQWMICLVPAGCVLLLCAWGVLAWRVPRLPGVDRIDRSFFSDRLRKLGRPSHAEWMMLVVFVSTALLWIFRKPLIFGDYTLTSGWDGWLRGWLGLPKGTLHDSTVAMSMAVLLFMLPARKRAAHSTEYLMDWDTTRRLPWGILLLIGGGFALADGFKSTGLSEWVGDLAASSMDGWSPVMVVAACCLMLTFLTEFTSNVATVSAILPILGAAAVSMGIDARLMMIPAAVSASCAFMLPIATPPNAIVFGSGEIRITQMMKYGFWLNLIGTVVITAVTFLIIVPQLGIKL